MGAISAIERVKGWARRGAAELYERCPGFLRKLRGKVTILMYHRVVTNAELSTQFIQPGMYVTRETLDLHIRFLREHFHVLSMHELLSMWRDGVWDAEQRYCVITFDDGWLDNYVHAFPVLRQYEVPATVFLSTGFIGTTMWFWPEQIGWLSQRFARFEAKHRMTILASLKGKDSWFNGIADAMEAGRSDALIETCKTATRERIGELVNRLTGEMEVRLPDQRLVMNWEEIEEMSAGRISFGSHSVTHSILTGISDSELHQEVYGSLEALRRRKLNLVPVFCYPNGDYSITVIRCVEQAGYCAATTTEPGWEDRDTSRLFQLRRVGVHNDLAYSNALFAFHLAGYNNLFHR